ncbi:MAG: RbsD/FucU domain-containing protein, partial [Bacteroidota bacterium]
MLATIINRVIIKKEFNYDLRNLSFGKRTGDDMMLMEISNLIIPEIYEVIYRMGHLDELVIADS